MSNEGPDFASFFAEHQSDVVRLAYVFCGDVGTAEEVTQEAFLRAYSRWEGGRLVNPAGWVRTVAVNLARSRWRRLLAEARALDRLGVAPPSIDVHLPVEVHDFWSVVRRLPRRQAEAIALHYGEDRSVSETARLMGCSHNTVKVQLHRGRRRLARLLADPQTQRATGG